jgi:methyl-accepting chemotaxis protein
MRDPTIPDGWTKYPSLAASSAEARDTIEQFCDFLEIDNIAKQHARVLLTLFTACADDVIGEFYREVQNSPIGSYIKDDAIKRLIPRQKAHWTALFNSDFNRDYVQSVRRIGIQHRDIALNPSWYVAGYAKLKLGIMQRIVALDVASERKICLLTTLEKYVALDMAIALATYDSVILD